MKYRKIQSFSGLLFMIIKFCRNGLHYRQCAKQNTDECKAILAEIELVEFFEDDGERLEPDIQEAINQSYIKIHEENHRLKEIEGDRPN